MQEQEIVIYLQGAVSKDQNAMQLHNMLSLYYYICIFTLTLIMTTSESLSSLKLP